MTERKKQMLFALLAIIVPGGFVAWSLHKLLSHKHETTWPRKHIFPSCDEQVYVTCVNCGKEFAYDWNYMKIGKELSNGWRSLGPASSRAIRMGRIVLESEGRHNQTDPDPRASTA